MAVGSGEVVRWVPVARVGDLPPDGLRRVEVEGRVLVLVNREGNYYALEAACPHQGGPLDQGKIWRGALECPWHYYRYDPATGENLYPADVFPDDMPHLREQVRPVKTFPAKVEAGRVFVGLPKL